MSLFESKVFWVCVVVCIGIAGLFGFHSYRSKAVQEPVVIYKTTQPDPIVRSPEKTQQNQVSVDQAELPIEATDSFEKELPEVEKIELDVLLSTSDEIEELTDGDSQVINQNDDMLNDETDLNFDPGDFSAELEKSFMSATTCAN